MSAQFEKIIVNADLLEIQNTGPDFRQHVFKSAARRDERIFYLRSRPIDLIDPTSGDRVLPGILEGDEPPDLPASTYRWFPVGNWPRWPRWPWS